MKEEADLDSSTLEYGKQIDLNLNDLLLGKWSPGPPPAKKQRAAPGQRLKATLWCQRDASATQPSGTGCDNTSVQPFVPLVGAKSSWSCSVAKPWSEQR